jgi:hypothetical protein
MNRFPAIAAALALLVPATRLPADDLDALGPAARSALARDKILIGTQEFKQSFTPYSNSVVDDWLFGLGLGLMIQRARPMAAKTSAEAVGW